VKFRIIGPSTCITPILGIHPHDVEASGPLRADLRRVALSELDVAIVPYEDRDASGLQALEFAAAGVPVIASQTREHAQLQEMGVPLWLVKNRPRAWERALRSVLSLDDDELRQLAYAHRESVRRAHTIEKRAHEWAIALRTAGKITVDIARQG
jgi:glycosyltransferase involved in cell wall biosynthesis